ncbi:hypothetical protein ACOME3_003005 [Neoechinorhynchus agilis]
MTMPKKFKGENTKSKEARERKEEFKKKTVIEQKAREEADNWRDDDRLIQKKANRKDERELKEQEKQRKRLELQKLKEEEDARLESKFKEGAFTRMTRAQIQATWTRESGKSVQPVVLTEIPLTNPNKPKDEAADEIEARDINAAISAMADVSQSTETPDRHPEKRMRVAFAKFEADNLPSVKAQNPKLRLTQWKQILYKQWATSPQNPMNQKKVS